MIAALVLAAIVVIPILLSSGGGDEQPLAVTQDGSPVGGTPVSAGTPGDTTDVESTLDALLATGSDVTSDTGEPATLPGSVETYVVQDGDTFSTAAAALGVSVANLEASNQLYGSELLQPGEVVYGSTDGVLHTIKRGQTLTDISLTYAVPIEKITSANGLTTSSTIYAGEKLLIPGVTTTYWSNVVRLSRGVPSMFVWPLEGEVVSTFGWRIHPVTGERHHHDGIDIDVPEGTPVFASASGEVYFYGEQPGYGNVLILQHAENYYSLYGHLSSSSVYVGQYVEAGQTVAQSGNTGLSSGPHLHFEIRNGEFPVDPLRYLP